LQWCLDSSWSCITELAQSLRFHSPLSFLLRVPAMQSRKVHAILACVLFLAAAVFFSSLTGRPIDPWRIVFWSMVGVASYVALSHAFGFDPHRTRVAAYAPALVHYIDRWELRLGQATLSMLGCVVVAASVIDQANFVTAVVSGTLSAWTYFALRLYAGGYRVGERLSRRGSH
jgi:small-conductance mechanosensitive channel